MTRDELQKLEAELKAELEAAEKALPWVDQCKYLVGILAEAEASKRIVLGGVSYQLVADTDIAEFARELRETNTLLQQFQTEWKEVERLATGGIEKAIALAVRYGGIDGAHHKAWVIDQMVRILAGDDYEKIVAEACAGEDGPQTYTWDEGIAP